MKLLVITNRYPMPDDPFGNIFVKSQIDILKRTIDKIKVISCTPYIPKILVPLLQPRRKFEAKVNDYQYDNVEVHYLKNISLPYGFFDMIKTEKDLKSTIKIIKKENFIPNLIHAHFAYPAGFLAMELKKVLNVKSILTVHGYDIYSLPFRNRYYHKTISKICLSMNKLIAVSKKNFDILKTLCKKKLSVKIIPNGYNPNIFHYKNKELLRKKYSISKEKKIILSVGNLIKIKGYDNIIEIANKICRKYNNVIFIIIGSGPEEKKLRNKIRKYNLQKQFKLLGSKSQIRISEWMSMADLFMLSSYNEGVPSVLFESMACGLPYVGSNVGGIPEIITNNNLGFVTNPHNRNKMENITIKAIEKDWNRDLIIKCASKYTWQRIGQDIYKTYNDLLG